MLLVFTCYWLGLDTANLLLLRSTLPQQQLKQEQDKLLPYHTAACYGAEPNKHLYAITSCCVLVGTVSGRAHLIS